MVINFYLALILSIFFILVLPLLIVIFIKNNKIINILANILFVLYIFVLLIATLFKVQIGLNGVYVNFEIYGDFCSKTINFSFDHISKSDLLLNLGCIVPVGIFISLKSKSSFAFSLLKALILGLLVGITIETLQFILPVPRSVQLSDAILNMISSGIGFLIGKFYLFIANIKNNKKTG